MGRVFLLSTLFVFLGLSACSGGNPAGVSNMGAVADSFGGSNNQAQGGPTRPPLTAEIDPQGDCRIYISENRIAEAPEECREIIENLVNMPSYVPPPPDPVPQRIDPPQIIGTPIQEMIPVADENSADEELRRRLQQNLLSANPAFRFQIPGSDEDMD